MPTLKVLVADIMVRGAREEGRDGEGVAGRVEVKAAWLREAKEREEEWLGLKPYAVETELVMTKRALAAVMNFIVSILCCCRLIWIGRV